MTFSGISHWGPSAWNFLHTMSYSYPETPSEKEKLKFYTFLLMFASVLPCDICKDDFQKYLDDKFEKQHLSDAFFSRETFTKFLIDAHNDVNLKLKKKVLSYDDVDKLYGFKPQTIKKRKFDVGILLLVVFIFLFVFMFPKFSKKRRLTKQ